jgi:hypothetical protein
MILNKLTASLKKTYKAFRPALTFYITPSSNSYSRAHENIENEAAISALEAKVDPCR